MTTSQFAMIASSLERDEKTSAVKSKRLPGFQIETRESREAWRRQWYDRADQWLKANDPAVKRSGNLYSQAPGIKDYGYYGPTEGEWFVGNSEGFQVMQLAQKTTKQVWTPAEDARAAALYEAGATVPEVAVTMGRKRHAMLLRLREIGVKIRGRWGKNLKVAR